MISQSAIIAAAVIISVISYVGGFCTAALLNMAKDEERPPMPQRVVDDMIGSEKPAYPRIDEKA